jgi:hypothetical protein
MSDPEAVPKTLLYDPGSRSFAKILTLQIIYYVKRIPCTNLPWDFGWQPGTKTSRSFLRTNVLFKSMTNFWHEWALTRPSRFISFWVKHLSL